MPETARPPLSTSLDAYRGGPLAPFLTGGTVSEIGVDTVPAPDSSDLVFAGYRLQDIADYRAALQTWFAGVRVGGHLAVVVPHAFLYERQNMLPSRRHPRQRRLYTPASLIGEIEEALTPNSYRLRWLGDHDAGYDYARGRATDPVGCHDVIVVLEKIVPPAWGLYEEPLVEAPAPGFAFEPDRTRIETVALAPHGRILALKLDHLGDFIMGVPAIEKLRATFPAADITLVVGSWNVALARDLGLVDHVLAFDAYPRNSSEEQPDVHGKTALFDALIVDHYDLAIDLRTDGDTRFLLRNVRAGVKAGLGTKPHFPFLDIFVPIDTTRHHHEAAWTDDIPRHHFNAQGYCRQTHYQISCNGTRVVNDGGALIWGPYRQLAPGNYMFEPFFEIDGNTPGLLGYDVALDIKPVVRGVLTGPCALTVPFANEVDGAKFEFRFFPVDDEPVPNFRFYGGRIIKQGAGGVLHQSEYLLLLIELVALRMRTAGLFGEQPAS